MSNLQTLIYSIETLSELKWGLRVPTLSYKAVPEDIKLKTSSEGFVPVESNYPYVWNTPDDQRLGSCVANSTTGIIESWIFRSFGKRVQLDYEKLYWLARDKFYHNREDDGLMPDEAFKTARLPSVKLLPEDTKLVYIGLDIDSICKAMSIGPVLLASSVHDGWRPKFLNKDNGAINERKDKGLERYTNGHATMGVGTNVHNNVQLIVGKNSWGPLGQGGSGLYCETVKHFFKWAMAKPILWVPGDSWDSWRGWEKYVVK